MPQEPNVPQKFVTYQGAQFNDLWARGWRPAWIGTDNNRPHSWVAWMEHPSTWKETIIRPTGPKEIKETKFG